MIDPSNVPQFKARTEQVSFEFLQADLALCFTFADLAETELSMHDGGAQRALAKAEDGYAAITRLLAHLKNAGHQHEIGHGLEELRARLDQLRPKVEQDHLAT